MRHLLRQFVAGREHEVLGADAPAVRRSVAMTRVLRGIDIDDLGRCEDARALRHCGAQHRERRLARIDRQIAVADESSLAPEAEALAQRLAREIAARQPCSAPGVVLLCKAVGIEHVAREIETVAARGVRHAEFGNTSHNRIHRQSRAAPRADRVALADLARELDQRRVDLVLHQRRAGGGRALGRSAPVHHHDLDAGHGQRIGDHRAGDAGADHQHVGLDVARQGTVRDGGGAVSFPDRAAGPQILWFRNHTGAF